MNQCDCGAINYSTENASRELVGVWTSVLVKIKLNLACDTPVRIPVGGLEHG